MEGGKHAVLWEIEVDVWRPEYALQITPARVVAQNAHLAEIRVESRKIQGVGLRDKALHLRRELAQLEGPELVEQSNIVLVAEAPGLPLRTLLGFLEGRVHRRHNL